MTERTISGGCQCGAVRYTVRAPATETNHCHCSICRKIHGAIFVTFATFPRDAFSIDKGADDLATYDSSPGVHRTFCRTCGGHLMTDHPSMGMVDVYLNVVPDFTHEPTLHVFYAERTMAVKDGLPKFKDMPAEFGGSGDTLPE